MTKITIEISINDDVPNGRVRAIDAIKYAHRHVSVNYHGGSSKQMLATSDFSAHSKSVLGDGIEIKIDRTQD